LKNDLYYFDHQDSLIPKGVILLNSDHFVPQVSSCDLFGDSHALELQFSTNTFFRGDHEVMQQFIKAVASQEHVDTFLPGMEDFTTQVADRDTARSEPPDSAASEGGGILCSGYLEKRGFKNTWTRLWCVVKQGELLTYNTKEDAEPQSRIGLSAAQPMRSQLLMTSYMRETNMIVVTHHKSIYIVAETAEQKNDWINGLQEAIVHVKAHKGMLNKNPTGWKRSGKVREVVVPLIDMLRDPLRCELFAEFLKEFGAEHYLRFWLDVQQFKRLGKKEQSKYLKPHAEAIFNKYVVDGSMYQIDLPPHLVEELSERLDTEVAEVSVDTFRDCQKIVLQSLYSQYYPQYLTSDLCQEMALKLLDEVSRERMGNDQYREMLQKHGVNERVW